MQDSLRARQLFCLPQHHHPLRCMEHLLVMTVLFMICNVNGFMDYKSYGVTMLYVILRVTADPFTLKHGFCITIYIHDVIVLVRFNLTILITIVSTTFVESGLIAFKPVNCSILNLFVQYLLVQMFSAVWRI